LECLQLHRIWTCINGKIEFLIITSKSKTLDNYQGQIAQFMNAKEDLRDKKNKN